MKNKKFKVPKDIWTAKKPNYYKINEHQDLLDLFEHGLLTHEQCSGFYIGNIIKYDFRFKNKGQKQADLNKALMYQKRLTDFELRSYK